MQFNNTAYEKYLKDINAALIELNEVRKLDHVECMRAIPSAMEKFDKVNKPALEELLKHRE